MRRTASSAAHDKTLAMVGSAITVLVLLIAFEKAARAYATRRTVRHRAAG
jgi:hypothetical protein